jgi:hydroxyacylglutathione hydrolase
MLFKQYESKGLAHFSYMIADQGQAAVIDPRRDVDIYLRDAAAAGYHIDHVLETHRNEDYVIGSCELQAATGAEIFHADGQMDYKYGSAAEDGQEWRVGRLMIRAIHTPGHTPGSMSYLLHDPDGNPWIIFTGDALFSGDVGRMDLLGEDRLEEMAGHMYDSIFNKILPLGDDIIVCPAHGAGSVCGSEIAERTWTTVGLERRLNTKLQVATKAEFIERNGKMLERPPYFRKMEVLNLEGAPILGRLPELRPLLAGAFATAAQKSQLVDTRDQVSFGAAHVPGSLSIWDEILPGFAGWFLTYDQPVLFVCDPDNSEDILRMMIRIGFDNLSGYLQGGILSWAMAGKALESIPTLSMAEFCDLMKSETPGFPLDIRSEEEIKGDGFKNCVQIHLTQLLDHLDAVPRDSKILPLCTSGYRSMLAASLLKKEGWEDVALPIGGLAAWQAFGCDFEL